MLTQSGRIYRHLGQGRVQAIARYFPKGNPLTLLGNCETDEGILWVSVTPSQTRPNSILTQYDSLGQPRQQHTFPLWLTPIGCDPDGTLYLQGSKSGYQLSTHRLDGLLYRLAPNGTLTPMPITFGQSPFAVIKSPFAVINRSMFDDTQVCYDQQRGLFWVSGHHVLFAWHPAYGVVFDLNRVNHLSASAKQNLRSAFIDRTGAVWVPSDGVLLITLEPNRFRRYLHTSEEQPNADRHSVRGMYQVGKRLWVNSEESHWVDLTTGRLQPTLPPNHALRPRQIMLYPLIRDSEGAFWSGASSLLHIDPANGPLADYAIQPPIAPPANTQKMLHALWDDGRHTIWVGFTLGLTTFDRRTKTEIPFTRYNQYGELARNRINGFFPDRQTGRVWVAATSGLYLLDMVRGIVARYSTHNQTLPFDHITFVYPDPDQADVYWLATRGGGLIRWNRRAGHYQQFTTKQGLSDNALYAIYADQHGRLWLPSNYGLMSFGRKNRQVQIFHVKDGITDEEFNLTAHHRAPDGRLFLGGLNGITAFYPDSIGTHPPAPAPLIVTQYQTLDPNTGNLTDHLADFQQTRQISLGVQDRLFTLSFALLDYRYLSQTRLWYRILGWQERWVMQNQMDLRINSLPPGKFTLQVRAQTINGDWISPTVTIPIWIATPFYLRTWFLGLVAIALMGSIWTYVQWRNGKLLRDKVRLEAEVIQRTAQIERDKATIAQQAADLQATVTLKSHFFANVSHEFRTPLTLLLGPIQYLTGRITDTNARQLLAAMERNTHHLLQLVNDLLDLTRLDVQQLRLTEQPTDLSHLIQQLRANVMAKAQDAGIHLTVRGADVPLWLSIDGPKVETVLRNLIANALRHTPANGTITISLTHTESMVTIGVADTGEGIHPDDLPHIFDRYFQTNQPDKTLRGGTGIGLAICQEYCQLWGGMLTVESALNRGSTFTVGYPIHSFQDVRPELLPASHEPKEAASAFVPLLVNHHPSKLEAVVPAETILLVDDNSDVLLYIESILSPQYRIQTARNGREALNRLNESQTETLPSLILSDVMMPEIDGLAFVTALRQQPALRAIPVVLLTARADLDVHLQALQLGVADYLTKPFHEAELLARIQNLLNRADEQAIWQQQAGCRPAECRPAASESTKLTPAMTDEAWIDWLQQLIRQNVTNTEFNVRGLAELTLVSERMLYRRVKMITGLTPNQLIQEVRLQIAHKLLQHQPDMLLKSVAVQVGYQKVAYFSQLYRERFGIIPGERPTR